MQATIQSIDYVMTNEQRAELKYQDAIEPLKNTETKRILRQAAGFIRVSDFYWRIMIIADTYNKTIYQILTDIGIEQDKEKKVIINRYKVWKHVNFNQDGSQKTSEQRKAERDERKSKALSAQRERDKRDGVIRVQGFPLEVAIEVVKQLKENEVVSLYKFITTLYQFAVESVTEAKRKELSKRKTEVARTNSTLRAVSYNPLRSNVASVGC